MAIPISIALVDDHEQFRRCIAALLSQAPGFTAIAQYASGEAWVEALRPGSGHPLPDVLVVDAALRGLGGIEATRQALLLRPRARVLALSMHDDPQIVNAMLQAGALSYVLKDDPFADLAQAVRDVALGRAAFSRSIIVPT